MSVRMHVRPVGIDGRQVVLGGLFIALGDAAFATTFWFSWSAAGVMQMFQSIAAGALGEASYGAGLPAALLGAALHVVMATLFVVVYAQAARREPRLLRRPLAYGIPFGVLLYVVMNFVVMPLSRIGRSPSLEQLDRVGIVVLAHMVFGVICVLFARRALR